MIFRLTKVLTTVLLGLGVALSILVVIALDYAGRPSSDFPLDYSAQFFHESDLRALVQSIDARAIGAMDLVYHVEIEFSADPVPLLLAEGYRQAPCEEVFRNIQFPILFVRYWWSWPWSVRETDRCLDDQKFENTGASRHVIIRGERGYFFTFDI